jgi:hypothetical protein
MAVLTDTFETYDAIGNREDLSDMIWDVSPTETPFLSAIPKTKAYNTNHEWQTDVLAAPAANAKDEGEIAAEEAVTPTVRMGNYTQILTKVTSVSGTQEKVNSAGRKSDIARNVARRMQELKRDLEWAMINGGGAEGVGNAKVAGSGNGATAREMGSIQCYIENGSVGATGGALAAAAGTSTAGTNTMTSGVNRAFTETLLTSVLSDVWEDGGDPKMLFVNAFNKAAVSGFVGGGTHYVDKDNKELVNSVDIYVGDFSTLKVIPSRQIAGQIALVIDPEYVSYAELRPMFQQDLAVTGDNIRKQIICEGTLVVRNGKAQGVIGDLTTA